MCIRDSIEDIASECFMPLSYGGGVTTMEQMRRLFRLGVEKIALNASAFTNRKLVQESCACLLYTSLCAQIVGLRPSKLVILEVSEAALYLVDQAVRSLPGAQGLEVVSVLGSVRDAKLCKACLLYTSPGSAGRSAS